MWKYAALVSYFGRNYCGWQRQKPGINSTKSVEEKQSVQATVEAALTRMTGEIATVVGSGRTDSGVHAGGQVVHFVLKQKQWDPNILFKGLNGILPSSIQVLDLRPVAIEFHAQRSAEKKQYNYFFQQGPCAVPHLEPYSWWIRRKLNVPAMQEALQYLVGEHDYKPFRASGARPGTTVRRILEADITCQPIVFPGPGPFSDPGTGFSRPYLIDQGLGLIRVRIRGTGFLKQMVRGIAGTLLQVGDERRKPDCMLEILQKGDRALVGPTAPARALWLEHVWYPEQFELPW